MVMDKSCVYSFRGAVMTPSNAAVFGRGLTACVSSGNLSRILLDCRSGAVVCHKMLVSGSSFRSVATIVDHLLCVSCVCVCAELKRSNALFSTSRPDAGWLAHARLHWMVPLGDGGGRSVVASDSRGPARRQNLSSWLFFSFDKGQTELAAH